METDDKLTLPLKSIEEESQVFRAVVPWVVRHKSLRGRSSSQDWQEMESRGSTGGIDSGYGQPTPIPPAWLPPPDL